MKTVTQIKKQIRRCQNLADELGKDWAISHARIIRAIESVCIAQYGCRPHTKELSQYLKKHPELH